MDTLCLDWANTRWYALHHAPAERLRETAWWAEFLTKWSLGDYAPAPRELPALLAFRDALFTLALHLSEGKPFTPQEVAWLNARLKQGRPCWQLTGAPGALTLTETPENVGRAWLEYRIALSLARLAAHTPQLKLRQCANPGCQWFFIDDSKSHSRKWCDSKCASLMKVRRYRARQAGES